MKKIFTLIVSFLITTTFIYLNAQVVQKKNITGVRDAGICFSINNKIYAGGGPNHKDMWEYNPANDSWTQKSDLPGVVYERGFGIGVAINGKGYVGLGGDSSNKKLKYDLWEYDPANDSWVQKANFPGFHPDGCAYFTVNNKLYVVGGTNNQTLTENTYEYNPATNTWRGIGGGQYPQGPLIFGTGFSIGDYGYVTCGNGASENNYTYRFDPVNVVWTQVADFPGTARQTAVAFVIGNLAYVGSGQKGYTQAFKDFYRYNPANDTWAAVGDISNKGRAWAMAASAGGKGYVGMGWDFGTTFFNDWWEFTPQNIAGFEDLSNTGIKAYYDMDNHKWVIEGGESLTGKVRILDISGRIITETAVLNTTQYIEVEHLNSGIYLLEAETANATGRQKFLVR